MVSSGGDADSEANAGAVRSNGADRGSLRTLSAKAKADGVLDAASLLLHVTHDDPVEALERIAQALRFRHRERFPTALKLVNACRDRMSSAERAGVQSMHFISGAQSKPSSIRVSSPNPSASRPRTAGGFLRSDDAGDDKRGKLRVARMSAVEARRGDVSGGGNRVRRISAAARTPARHEHEMSVHLHGMGSNGVVHSRAVENGGSGRLYLDDKPAEVPSRRSPSPQSLHAPRASSSARASSHSRVPFRGSPPSRMSATLGSSFGRSTPVGAERARPRTASDTWNGGSDASHGEGIRYGVSKEQISEWKKEREEAEEKREESMRRAIEKEREYINQIYKTKRPWRRPSDF